MINKEQIMYEIMSHLHKSNLPIVFKGALITKLILSESGLDKLTRETKDIDANWVGTKPTMADLVESVNTALSTMPHGLKAVAHRDYGEKQSAGLKIVVSNGDEVLKMDIDIKQVESTRIYWYGTLSFRGTTVNQILCDKISSLSGEKIFRRIKDMLDVYALSKCVGIEVSHILETAKATGRIIGDFNMFLNAPLEVAHAYGKLRGVVEKPEFDKVYNHVKIFISPFITADTLNMVWNCDDECWGMVQVFEEGMTPPTEDEWER